MRRVITLLLATSSASGFVSSPLRLLHRQVVASDSTKLFSSPFFSIELVDADHTTSDGCKCIRIADDTTTTILENMDPNAWAINPIGTEGYRTAEVTLGGIDTEEISSKTMMSNKHPGLFFIGEVVDVTGHLGGYNFQWAWSSGYVAGQYA